MFTYVVLYILRVKYGLDVYGTENNILHLSEIFENVSDIPIAERSLCGFRRFHREFSTTRWNKIWSYTEQEMEDRKNQTKDFFGQEKSVSKMSVLHSSEIYAIKNEIDENLTEYSSFPWEEFTGDMREFEGEEKKKGKAYLLFPMGMTMETFDETFGEDLEYQMDDIPGIIDFTLRSFTFKKVFRDRSEEILRNIGEHFRQENKKKFKKKQDITYVGIHNRRGDHLDFQKEAGYIPLEPGYFIEAMEMFRERYKRVVFIYVSDDMRWGQEKLKRRIKTKDFYLAGSLQDEQLSNTPFLTATYDLSLLAACNHTITSYGTYSFWASALAGEGRGKRIIPPFFPKYRLHYQTSSHYNIDPFESNLPKFYYVVKYSR